MEPCFKLRIQKDYSALQSFYLNHTEILSLDFSNYGIPVITIDHDYLLSAQNLKYYGWGSEIYHRNKSQEKRKIRTREIIKHVGLEFLVSEFISGEEFDEKGEIKKPDTNLWVAEVDTVFESKYEFQIFIEGATRQELLERLAIIQSFEILPTLEMPLIKANHSDSLEEKLNNGSSNRLKREYALSLPCMERSKILELLGDHDSISNLIDDFQYEKLSEIAAAKDFQKEKSRNRSISDCFERNNSNYGLSTNHREHEIMNRLVENKYTINDYLNYINKKNVSGDFDSLAHILLDKTNTYEESKICRSLIHDRFNPRQDKLLSDITYDSSNCIQQVRLRMDYFLRRYILSTLLAEPGREENELKLLLDSENKDVFILPSRENENQMLLINFTFKNNGIWDYQLDTLPASIFGDSLIKAKDFNDGLLFYRQNECISYTNENGISRTSPVTFFPFEITEYPAVIRAESEEELTKLKFQNINQNWCFDHSTYPVSVNYLEDFAYLKILEERNPNDIVYLHQGLSDLNSDGLKEIYSFAFSNGELVHSMCYSVLQGKFQQVETSTANSWLSTNVVFRNMRICSKLGNQRIPVLKKT